MTSININ